MKRLVFFLEEPSAQDMLKGILPRILPVDIVPQFIVFRGKQDLEKRLPLRLREWRTPNTRFIVLRDQDAADCMEVKKALSLICRNAGKPETLVRVACRELESFYLGDLSAVEKGIGIKNLSKQQNKKKFRTPDDLGNPSEELFKITRFKYQKRSGSRAIAPFLSLDNNFSISFNMLINGIRKMAENNAWFSE